MNFRDKGEGISRTALWSGIHQEACALPGLVPGVNTILCSLQSIQAWTQEAGSKMKRVCSDLSVL